MIKELLNMKNKTKYENALLLMIKVLINVKNRITSLNLKNLTSLESKV